MTAPPYLVFFSRDPVDDELAEAISRVVRALANERAWPGAAPGWFDEPDADAPEQRTAGGYARVEDLASDDAAAVLRAARRLSVELEIVVEVQWRERKLGELRAGEPDGALVTLLSG
jgi:hypothetical protein